MALAANGVVGFHTLVDGGRGEPGAAARSHLQGIGALAVHAKNERARGFYEHFGFRPSPSDPLYLFVLLKNLHSMSLMY